MKQRLNQKKIIITYAIMTICTIMFLLTYALGNGSMNALTLYKFGAVSAPAIQEGEIWRLLTGTLLHAGLIHLFVNMYSFCIFYQLIFYAREKRNNFCCFFFASIF